MFTEREVKAAKATREAVIKGDVAELKSIYMAGEICMWDEMQSRQAVGGSLPSATRIATDFIQEMMCDEIEPKAIGNIHPITEDVLKEWFIQIGMLNGNDR